MNKELKITDREWICPECGARHDRDLLAANNILRRGIDELGNPKNPTNSFVGVCQIEIKRIMEKTAIKLNETTLRKMISESISRVLREEELDFLGGNEFKWDNGYDAYVLVDDSCDAVIGNYGPEGKEEAISDAKKQYSRTRGGSFSVFGCKNDMYDEDSLVYCTTSNRNSWKF